MAATTILVVDDEPDIRTLVQEILEDEGYKVAVAADAQQARAARLSHRPDLILLDIWMPDLDGISLLREWSQSEGPIGSIVMMSGHGNVETAVEATKLGAYDFIEKPISLAKLLITVERALETTALRKENEGLRKSQPEAIEPVGISDAMIEVRGQAERLANHDTWVLLTGEAGVGKQTLARYLHHTSQRSNGPFVEMKVGSIAPVNSAMELFGREDGTDVHLGRLEQANGGTLLLNEVADMQLETQKQLSSALESQSFLRLAGNEEVSVDVRVIGTTRRNLEELIAQGRFREELYYQLNVVPLHIPPLRERREDVPELLKFFAEFFPERDGLPYRHFSVGAQNRLRNHDWPGNVLELRNLVQRLLILGKDDEIDIVEVEQALGAARQETLARQGEEDTGYDMPLREAREQFERGYLIHHLRETEGSVGKLAKIAGMERTHLYRKLRALGVDAKKMGKSAP